MRSGGMESCCFLLNTNCQYRFYSSLTRVVEENPCLKSLQKDIRHNERNVLPRRERDELRSTKENCLKFNKSPLMWHYFVPNLHTSSLVFNTSSEQKNFRLNLSFPMIKLKVNPSNLIFESVYDNIVLSSKFPHFIALDKVDLSSTSFIHKLLTHVRIYFSCVSCQKKKERKKSCVRREINH